MARAPLILEIIGLAGSGKTTLAKALCAHNQQMLAGQRLVPGRLRCIPFCLSHFASLFPFFFFPPRDSRRLTRQEMKSVIYLKGWHRVLKRQAQSHNAVVVVDQGAVFKLANLRGFGPPWLNSPRFEKWWDQWFARWASVLDFIVCLDAADEVLIKRIRSRHTWHSIKDQSTDSALRFLSTYRSAGEHVVSRLAAHRRIKLMHFDTSRQLPQEILGDILTALEERDSKHNKLASKYEPRPSS